MPHEQVKLGALQHRGQVQLSPCGGVLGGSKRHLGLVHGRWGLRGNLALPCQGAQAVGMPGQCHATPGVPGERSPTKEAEGAPESDGPGGHGGTIRPLWLECCEGPVWAGVFKHAHAYVRVWEHG